jgi:membrane-bound lytic murein transglycosylase D
MRAQAPTITQPAHSPAHKIEEKRTPKSDPVDATVAAAEKEYEAGRTNYNAGHLEAAKENFDRAFDLLLSGPAEVNLDERLQQEFEKIVEGVHQLELQALKEGDGFTEQRAEPAPIDEANEVTFPVDPSIKAKAEQELKTTQSDLPLTLNDTVAGYINYFSTRGRGYLEHGYVRSGRYREMILKTLKDEGVPQDLIYLAQAESGFHPLALSHAGARGMWQFMMIRAVDYGLSRNWWVDDRLDPVKSTRAAARHLRDLYKQFGDWYLAMAAYNSGPGTVQRAVERTGYADYWQLYRRGVLPAETRNYVPIILAMTIMSKNPTQYGLDRLTQDAPLPFDSITIRYPVDLRLVAECADTSVATLQELNPSLLRLTTPKDKPFELRLPEGAKEKFREAIAAIPADMRVWWRYHRVTSGDTLTAIARKYHTTVAAIERVNDLRGEDLHVESKLIIPVTPGRRDTDTLTFSKRPTRYKVRKGDTILSVADDFGVPAQSVRKWNRLKGNTLVAGRVLVIYRPVTPRVEDQREASSGTGPSGGSTGMAKTGSIHSKTVLSQDGKAVHGKTQLPPADSGKSVMPETVSAKTGRREPGQSSSERNGRLVHRVKKGETLSSIASAYNVSISELRRNNKKIAANLRAGDLLVIRTGE